LNHVRPIHITNVLPILSALATRGAVRANCEYAEWLLAIGAAFADESQEWLYADPHWIRTVAPASDNNVFLRRTAIRDPTFRFHLDLMLSEVLETIGEACRWERLEELLFARFIPFAARFAQVLDYAISRCAGSRPWVPSLRAKIERDHEAVFAQWDRELWGEAPNSAAGFFPLLTDFYLPLVSDPVNVNAVRHRVEESSAALLASAIRAAQNGQCCLLSSEVEPRLNPLFKLGLPVRCWPPDPKSPDRRLRLGIVAPVRLVWSGRLGAPGEGAFVPTAPLMRAQDCCVHAAEIRNPALSARGFWGAGVEVPVLAFPGFRFEDRWPDSASEAPVGLRIPKAEDFLHLGLSAKRSPEVDSGLQELSSHLLFGFLLQLLLIEALDRELGFETISFTATNTKIDRIDSPEVRVLYRPPLDDAGHPDGNDREFYDLGDLQTVTDKLASTLGISRTPQLSDTCDREFWISALNSLQQIGIVTVSVSSNRWSLSIEALDRLHSGSLMPRVIRAGKLVRDCLRDELNGMWKQVAYEQKVVRS
jgi:hypothetical protein